MQSRNVYRRENLDVLYEGGSTCAERRNPYLVEFEAQRSHSHVQKRPGRTLAQRRQPRRRCQEAGFTAAGAGEGQGRRRYAQAGSAAARSGSGEPYIWEQPAAGQRGGNVSRDPMPVRRASGGRAAASRRRKRILMQRALVGVWIFCILVLAATLLIENSRVSAGQERGGLTEGKADAGASSYSGYLVQGLPAEEFAKHPAWTEDFLTVNEYSRPGDPLESVKSIFVHYTANPGTSAAQNRSYFEWLKDTHETSASAHFVIGYEGEIIQCVPLNEIAYAVQSRNGDSVSIECCYLEADGSFTQETYDSLIALLKWLVDVYDLETGDILRHYDCGGKKCPLYYTDNPDEWEELKKDVDKL